MFPFEINYRVSLSDFRKATYYGLVLRHRRPLLIMLVVLAGSLLYYIGAALGLGQANYLVFFLAAAYLIWGIFLFAGAERQIRGYLKSPDCLLSCDYTAVFEEHRLRIRIPQRKIDNSYPLNKLACAFELNDLLLLFISAQDVYIVPKRELSSEQLSPVRENLRSKLNTRFSSRF